MNKILSNEMKSKDEVFSQEIVDTFFGTAAKPKKSRQPSDTPHRKTPIILTVEEPKTSKKQKIILGLLLLLVMLSVAYVLRLPHDKVSAKTPAPLYDNYTRIFNGGSFSGYLVKSFAFEGDAKEKSTIQPSGVKLAGAGPMGWSRASFALNVPLDFSRANLLLLIRSEPGTKDIALIMADDRGNIRRVPVTVSPRWEWKSITMKEKNYFNIRKVNSIAVEFRQSAGNEAATEIYIKEMGLRTARIV